MPLEIRELIVKVTVEDDGKQSSHAGISAKDQKKLIDDCVKRVVKKIGLKNQR